MTLSSLCVWDQEEAKRRQGPVTYGQRRPGALQRRLRGEGLRLAEHCAQHAAGPHTAPTTAQPQPAASVASRGPYAAAPAVKKDTHEVQLVHETEREWGPRDAWP